MGKLFSWRRKLIRLDLRNKRETKIVSYASVSAVFVWDRVYMLVIGLLLNSTGKLC